MRSYPWRHLFVKRDEELAWLLSAWHDARAGKPRFVTLLGESGLGKTRLIQEFYRKLSREEDPGSPDAPEGYWPDAFTRESGSLDINPDLPKDRTGPTPPIPWLWWGLRWPMPERRNEVAVGCALIDARSKLEPHIEPILAARELEKLRKDASWKTLGLLAQAVEKFACLGWLTFARDAVQLMRDDRRAERELLDAQRAGPGEHASAQLVDLETHVFETFRLILDPKKTQAPTVPVILVLDDAQWADPTTLRFVSRLLKAAIEGNWSLLVIATHWEAEWRANVADAPGSADAPTQLADFPRLLGWSDDEAHARVLPPIADLGELVRAALPGVTADQVGLILEKAGGNPRLLEEIFHHLLAHPQFFEGRDLARPLSKRAEKEIREERFEYHDLVDKRFSRLNDDVRRALGWSSAQGMRFLTRITEAVARRVAPSFDPSSIGSALETAEDPHSLVQLFRDEGRFNLGEFRQAAFQHVARENLSFDEAEEAAVEAALRDVLSAWLRDEASDDFANLDPTEKRDALLMARRVFSPTRPETRAAWAVATARLCLLNASEYLWPQALAAARELVDAAPPDSGWSLGELPASEQWKIAAFLLEMRDLNRAHRFVNGLLDQFRREWIQPPGHDLLRFQAVLLDLLGDVESRLGDLDSALSTYRRGLTIREQLLATSGDHPDYLREFSMSLDHIGDIEWDLGRWDSALSSYVRSLEIAERLATTNGENPESLRDLSVSLMNVGNLEVELGRRDSALAYYRRCLAIRERLVSLVGETPESLRDLSVALLKVGDMELQLGDGDSALPSYRRGLAIREQLISLVGETPESIRNLSVSLIKLGDAELRRGDHESSLSSYRRALMLFERLSSVFGETPESLRDVSGSLVRVSDVQLLLGNRESALALSGRALSIAERLLSILGETPQSLRDVSVSLSRVGKVEFELGRQDEALSRYLRGLELEERLLSTFGATPQSLHDLSMSLDQLGMVELKLGHRESALSRHDRSLKIREQIVRDFGESPTSLRQLMFSRVIMASMTEGSEAVGWWEGAKELVETIIARGWAVPQTYEDLKFIEAAITEAKGGETA